MENKDAQFVSEPIKPQTTPQGPGVFSAADFSGASQPIAKKARRVSRVAAIMVVGLLVLLSGTGIFLWQSGVAKQEVASTTPAGNFADQKVPLGSFAGIKDLTSPDLQLTINGQLQISNGLTLTPMSQPTAGIAGQVYYDKDIKTIGYYDGEQFVSLASTQQVSALQTQLQTLGGTVASRAASTGPVTNVTNVSNVSNVSNVTQVTNVSETIACTSCVALQGEDPTDQVGNIALDGSVRAHKVNLRAGSNDPETFTVETATGEKLISADTLNRNITVGNLLPTEGSTGVKGTSTPGYTIDNRVYTPIADINGGYADMSRWGVRGQDGFMRYVFVDQNTSDVVYVRCTSDACESPIRQIVASDAENWTDFPTISLDASGNAYISYMAYTDPKNTVHLVHCSDSDCGVFNNELITEAETDTYAVVVGTGPDGLARIAYDSYTDSSDQKLMFIRCLNATCSSRNQSEIATDVTANEWDFETMDMVIAPNGSVYIAYHIGGNTPGLQLMYCTTSDCATRTTTTMPVSNNYNVSLALGSDGLPRLAFESYNRDKLYFVRCLTAACDTAVPVEIATGDSLRVGGIILDAEDKAAISYIGDTDQGETIKLIECASGACDTHTASAVSAEGENNLRTSRPYLTSTGDIGVAYFNRVNDKLMTVRGLSETVVLPVVTAPQDTYGTSIGSSTNRFGQLFGATLDLQGYGSEAALVVNSKGGAGAEGALASFQVDGAERVAIDANGKLNVGNVGALAQPGAVMNLLAITNSEDILNAYGTEGDIVMRVKSDGGIISGGSTSCDGCVPTSTINSLSIGPDETRSITQIGNYAYVSSDNFTTSSPAGYGLTVLDVSNPTQPKVTSQLEYKRGSVSKFIKHGNYGYLSVLNPANQIVTFDMTDPAKPKKLSSVNANPDVDIFGMAAKDSHLFVMARSGMIVYDISNPALPVRVNFLTLDSSEWGKNEITIIGNTAMVRNDNDGVIYSVDISNPAAPALVNTLALTTSAGTYSTTDMPVSGNAMYVPCANWADCLPSSGGGQPAGFYVFDVSNPAAPAQIKAITLETKSVSKNLNNSEIHLKVKGSYLYASDGHSLSVFDITDPFNPVLRQKFVDNDAINIYEIIGDAIYVSSVNSAKLRVLAKATESSFQKLTATTLTVTAGAEFQGSLSVSGQANFTQNTSVSDGANLIVGGLGIPPQSFNQFYQNGSLAYSPGTTYYYKLTLLGDKGESAPATYTVPGNSFDPTSAPSIFFVATAAPGGSGSLTGTYRYKITYTTVHGETTPSSDYVSAAASSQRITIDNVYPGQEDVTGVKFYRCTMPACSSYQLVGTVARPSSGDNISFTDNNTTPGAVAPTVNNAYTNDNYVYYVQNSLPEWVTGARLYRSTDGVSYTYTEVQRTDSGINIADGRDGDSYSWTAGTPPKTASGRLGVGTADPRTTLDVVGTAMIQSATNVTDAFQVQNAAGTTILDVDTVNSRVGVGTATPSASLHVSATGAGGALFRVTDTTATARDVFDIADTGIATFRNQTDSASALRVQNAAGTTIFTVNTTNLRVEIASGADIHLAGAGNTRNAITKTYTCTATEAVNDIVAITGAATVGRTTTAMSNRVAGVVVSKPTTTSCAVAVSGSVQVSFGSNATPATIGDPVTTSTVAGAAQSTTAPATGSVLGVSTSAKDGSNLVWVLLRGN